MSTTIRKALGPIRKRLAEELDAKPNTEVEFPSARDRDAHYRHLLRYKEQLNARFASFKEYHEKLLAVDCDDDDEQKIIEEWAEENANILIRFDDVRAAVDAAINEIKAQIETEIADSRWQDELALRREVETASRAANIPAPAFVQRPVEIAHANVRLPKLEMPRFNGDTLLWSEFWDAFETSVHNNPTLQAIDKMNYLRAQLTGEARRAISGLSSTNENYEVVIKMLRERYGKKRIVVEAHYKALSNLPISSNQLHKLRQTFDIIEQNLNALEAIGENIDHQHMISLILSKLPSETIFYLEETLKDEDDRWDVKTLRGRLRKYLQSRERAESHGLSNVHYKSRTDFPAESKGHSPALRSTTSALMTGTKGQNRNGDPYISPKCFFCEDTHWTDECTKYVTINARKAKIKGHCFVCLRKGHSHRECKSDRACVHCKKRKNHHRSLCPQKFSLGSTNAELVSLDANVTPAAESRSVTTTISRNAEGMFLSSGESVLLQTAKTTVSSTVSPRSAEIRLLMDTGSHRSYVSQKLAKELGLKLKRKEILSVYTFGSLVQRDIESDIVDIKVKLLDGSFYVITTNVVPVITGEIHRSVFSANHLSSPLYTSLPLADTLPTKQEDLNIQLLIGNDFYWDLMLTEKIQIKKGLYLVDSKLGWILTGRYRCQDVGKLGTTMMFVTSMASTPTSSLSFESADEGIAGKLDEKVFWDLETIGIRDRTDDVEDEQALHVFNQTVQYDGSRYYVKWPWKALDSELPSNFHLAKGRLNSLLRRYKDDPEFFRQYQAIIDSQLESGMIEKVTDASEIGDKKHYLPHHAVITPHKATTKLRIVYDGSAKTRKDSLSLNDCLLRGPVFLEDACSLLIRFRLNPVALVADIEKAFLQVGLQVPERDVTRFLWLRNPEKFTIENNLQVYRFTRVPFGIISSPFLLAATIRYHLLKDGSAIATRILDNIYVDNIITGTASLEEAIEVYTR